MNKIGLPFSKLLRKRILNETPLPNGGSHRPGHQITIISGSISNQVRKSMMPSRVRVISQGHVGFVKVTDDGGRRKEVFVTVEVGG